MNSCRLRAGIRRLDEHDLIAHGQHRHRREIALPMVGQARIQRRGDGQRTVGREIERIAVGLRACRGLGPDHAAGPRPVVHYELLSPDARQLGAEQADDDVAGAARRVRQDEAHRPIGKILCRRAWRRARAPTAAISGMPRRSMARIIALLPQPGPRWFPPQSYRAQKPGPIRCRTSSPRRRVPRCR